MNVYGYKVFECVIKYMGVISENALSLIIAPLSGGNSQQVVLLLINVSLNLSGGEIILYSFFCIASVITLTLKKFDCCHFLPGPNGCENINKNRCDN